MKVGWGVFGGGVNCLEGVIIVCGGERLGLGLPNDLRL